MSPPGATPLFVDTGAFFAYFVRNDTHHERARNVVEGIRDGRLPYRPLATSGYVLGELATLLLRKASHEQAVEAVERLRESAAIRIQHPGTDAFDAICESFRRYDDQQISFVDHSTAVLARTLGTEHVFSFDSDFRTLGFTLVPGDTGEG